MKKRRFVYPLLLLCILLTLNGCFGNNSVKEISSQAESSELTTESTSDRPSHATTSTDAETDASSTTVIESGEVSEVTKRYTTMDVSKSTSTSTSRTTTTTTTAESTEETTTQTTSRKRLADYLKTDIFTTVTTTKAVHGNDFFNDAVFIGDSVSLGLRNYAVNERNNNRQCLGSAQFLCAGSMGFVNSRYAVGQKNAIHPKYQGKEMMIEDAVKACGAKKVFIMLGMNDFSGYNRSVVKQKAIETFTSIEKVNPEVKIYVQSVTPVTKNKEHGNFTNESIDKFNKELKAICDEYGYEFVDVASVMKDGNNSMKPEYCGDNTESGMGIHMSSKGCKAWVDYLINNF